MLDWKGEQSRSEVQYDLRRMVEELKNAKALLKEQKGIGADRYTQTLDELITKYENICNRVGTIK